MLTQDINKSNVIHVVTDTFHNTPYACCCDLKVIVFFIGFIIKIYKLIGKPGTWIQRNTNPFCHASQSHILQNIHLICDLTCIVIDFLSLHCQSDSSRKALKKLHSKSVFQCLDHLAHTGLCRIEDLRRITERPCLGTCHKIL